MKFTRKVGGDTFSVPTLLTLELHEQPFGCRGADG